MTSRMTPALGAHVSAAGGLSKAPENAAKIGAQCMQIFGAPPRQFRGKIPPETEIAEYREALERHAIGSVFLHASYLVNLATPNSDLREKSCESLVDHLHIAEAIGAEGLIFHMGSSKGRTRESALAQTIENMKTVLEKVPGKSWLVMENSAGGGDKLGTDPEELAAIKKAVGNARVKVCIDTAHAFEAGLIDRFTPKEIADFLKRWDSSIGLKNIAALHINDSKTGPGSHHDRHENLGEGYIGISGFHNLAAEKNLHHAAWILEVPGFDGGGPDKKNLDLLKSCFGRL